MRIGYVCARDLIAAALLVLFGIFVTIEGRSYGVGTLQEMDTGFFPVVLGIGVVFVGVLIAGAALADPQREELIDGFEPPRGRPDWRGWACITSGVAAFILFGITIGLVPATFGCVFLAALGDRTATFRGSLVLAVVMTVFTVVLFSLILQLQMPLFRW